jgi:transcriptional regulator of arginine metabolism
VIILKKNERQAIIKQLILNQEVETQDELMGLLKEKGVCSTQATISRDMRELNIAKTYTKEGKTKYTIIATTKFDVTEKFKLSLKEYLKSMEQVEFMTVIHTVSNGADVIANYLDEMELKDVIATMAGFDVLLILSPSKEQATQLIHHLEKYIES